MALTHDVPAGPPERWPDGPRGPQQDHVITRRRFLGAVGAAGFAAASAVAVDQLVRKSAPTGPTLPAFGDTAAQRTHAFVSRPDLRPPRLEALTARRQPTERGLLLIGPGSEQKLTQQGPMIIDNHGEPIWFQPLPRGLWASNVRATTYQGEPVVAWWEGAIETTGYGRGEAVIVNAAYEQVARVRAANGRSIDLHEFEVTPEGTALFTCYPQVVRVDLSKIGGPRDGRVLESILQEVEISSGKLLWEWRSLDHIGPHESYKPYTGAPFDYLHLNSINLLGNGNVLVSGRHTWALYSIARGNGAVVSRLGGKRSDYTLDPEAVFSWQHDARVHGPDGHVITVFDNGSDGPQQTESQSRGLMLHVDHAHRSVSLRHDYTHPVPVSASSMGSVQTTPGGRVLVGWGLTPSITEFTRRGRIVHELRLPDELYTYRAYRQAWDGVPNTNPAIAVRESNDGSTRVAYVSWNGDTRTTTWQLRVGSSPDALAVARSVPRHGFETAIPVPTGEIFVGVTALDGAGNQLGHTDTLPLS